MEFDVAQLLREDQLHLYGDIEEIEQALEEVANMPLVGLPEPEQILIYMEDNDPQIQQLHDDYNEPPPPQQLPPEMERIMQRLFASHMVTTKQSKILLFGGYQYYKEHTKTKPNKAGQYYCSWYCKNQPNCPGRATSYR